MKSQPITKTKEASKVTVGSVLIAQPFWNEDIYKRSVILITDHDAFRTRGIMINKTSAMTVHAALPEIDTDDSVYFGGPIAPGMITCVHGIQHIPEADYLGCGLFIGGDTEYITEVIGKNEIDLEKIKFCAGVVEWNAGELDHELTEKKWWISKITSHEVFDLPPEILWSELLMQMNNLYGFIAQACDLSLN
jgi:putative transcriptional regulator